jgi:RNA polymerase sigma-70 factor (ECF subfamily)
MSTDAELFAQSVERPDALAAVFDRHAGALLRYLTRRLGAVDAEDVLGDVFVVALERRASFDRSAASARPWLYGIASKIVARRYRDETRRLRAYERGDHSDDDLFEDAAVSRVDAHVTFRRLAGVLSMLSVGDRDVLLMSAWAQLNQTEIADALGIPVGTVKSRLHRARQQLREVLDDDEGAGEKGKVR